MGSLELQRYIESVWNEPLVLGKHDCLTFCNAAFKAYHGYGWADDWLGRYSQNPKRDTLKKEFGFSTFTEAVDSKLKRVEYVPPLGALVTTKQASRWIIGVAMGICTGTKAVFLSKEGVLYLPLDYIHQAWVKEI